MSSVKAQDDSLTSDLFAAYDEFRAKFAPQQNSFPSIDDFQRKMIGKGYLLYQTSDYLSSIIYLSIALWTYAIKPKSEESVNSLKKFIADTRGKLKSSLSNDQNSDIPKYNQTSESDMRDRTTGKLISFATMSGATREKSIITNKFIFPNLYPHLFLSDSNNILLYGPPGTGKTLIAKACVGELNRQSNGEFKFLFYSLSASDVRSKWEGQTEKNIAAMFETASNTAKAEEEKYNKSSSSSSSSSSSKRIRVKSILFLDEVESIAESREKGGDGRALTTLLQKMDGMKSEDNVIIMGATNLPWDLDPAFVRRFSASVFVDLPDFLARVDLLINTFIDKYEKHSDVRRLLSFVVVPESNDAEWKKISEYEIIGDDEPTKRVLETISRMFSTLPKDERRGKTPSEKYASIVMNRIKEIVSTKNIKVDWGVWMKERFEHYITFVNFIFYISDMMGPSSKVLKKFSGGTLGKRAIPKPRTKYGYSASDITKIVSEFFSITAEKIIQSRFSQTSTSSVGSCDDDFIEKGSRKNNCYVKLISQESIEHANDGMFFLISDSKKKEERFLNEKFQDSYTVFVPRLFEIAMDNYPSTTGNLDMYCNYIEYERTGTTPNWKARCETIDMEGDDEDDRKKRRV
ncbi:MAG: AAA family ATPase [Candidatus Colwellbacteria bacterium]|nr:AAA family ATPase [Candidatus Colwellbacteria bacterium]